MSAKELQTINTKAHAIRVRNNEIERKVSALEPTDRYPYPKRETWEDAMTLLGDQFASIQELIGMTRP